MSLCGAFGCVLPSPFHDGLLGGFKDEPVAEIVQCGEPLTQQLNAIGAVLKSNGRASGEEPECC
jgi:hypothetical protein